MIHIESKLTVGQVPPYRGETYGKLQVSSKKLGKEVTKKFQVHFFLFEMDEQIPEEIKKLIEQEK